MLVYDITNEKSFDNIKNWIRNIEEHASADVEKMILGNKCDVNEKRQVSKERGEKLANDYGIKFMETSAKANINVENAFFTLARDIKTKMDKKLEGNSPQGSTQGVRITSEQKKSSFFRCLLLWRTLPSKGPSTCRLEVECASTVLFLYRWTLPSDKPCCADKDLQWPSSWGFWLLGPVRRWLPQ